MNRTIKIAYDASDNIQYWGKETSTGEYLINRYYDDADGNIDKIVMERLGNWEDRENLDW